MRPYCSTILIGALALTVLGCGSPGEKLVKVTGKVTVDGRPWNTGHVGFFPDASRGNVDQIAPVGRIAADGSYELLTSGKPGAPLGWYKVVIWATEDPQAAGNPWGKDGKLKPVRWLINAKYTSKDTTSLEVEVVDNPAPGQYDLRLTNEP
jgi:hypothetical protein